MTPKKYLLLKQKSGTLVYLYKKKFYI